MNDHIYPKAQAPENEETERMAAHRAKRWEARYDEALDMAARWQQQYVDLRKERDELRDLLEETRQELERATYIGKHRKEDPKPYTHPNCMIEGGGQVDGQRNRDSEG